MNEMSAAECAERLEKISDATFPQYHKTISFAASVLHKVAAGELVEVVHGRWREDTEPADGDLRCTRCGVAWPKCTQDEIAAQGIWTLQTLFKYCPRCGCKMDGGEKHANP